MTVEHRTRLTRYFNFWRTIN